ncbi:protein lin-37 homolog [Ascaphus truei]|uniref:protein lin-37 homolog n=1 Tax=Ascaphus truei TaxID=8439 RepID=UPI003F5A07F0
MSLVKVKVEKTDLEPASARNRLDAVLQGLLDKNDVDREQMEEEAGKTSTDSHGKDSSPSAAGKRPPARLSHHRRKKRKEDDGIEGAQLKANTYIIRLFDRSVDLAQFSEETPLYPVCRAWLRNTPTAKGPDRPQTPPPPPEEGEGVNGSAQDLYRLPPPVPCPVTEGGEPVNLRIPSSLPRDGEPLNLNTPPDLIPTMSTLIYRNMNRWKKIRQRWKDSSYRNQQRYSQSMKILKEMYERQ